MRIATFNLENLDEEVGEQVPTLQDRIAVLKPQLARINADILCLQEVHGQERPGEPRDLLALDALVQGTLYEQFHRESTLTSEGQVYDKRNLVVLSRYPILRHQQIKNDKIGELRYRRVSAIPEELDSKKVGWERPVLHCEIDAPGGRLHVINLHLKSRIPTTVPGQKDGFQYLSASGWAEGYFISSMKRVGQALETRVLIDQIFDADSKAKIIVCGDFNAEPGQVPVEAIVGRMENIGNPALRNRQLLAASDSLSRDQRYTHIHAGERNLLDHLLFSEALLASYLGSGVHNEQLHDESLAFAVDKKYPESDHAPFIARFADPPS